MELGPTRLKKDLRLVGESVEGKEMISQELTCTCALTVDGLVSNT